AARTEQPASIRYDAAAELRVAGHELERDVDRTPERIARFHGRHRFAITAIVVEAQTGEPFAESERIRELERQVRADRVLQARGEQQMADFDGIRRIDIEGAVARRIGDVRSQERSIVVALIANVDRGTEGRYRRPTWRGPDAREQAAGDRPPFRHIVLDAHDDRSVVRLRFAEDLLRRAVRANFVLLKRRGECGRDESTGSTQSDLRHLAERASLDERASGQVVGGQWVTVRPEPQSPTDIFVIRQSNRRPASWSSIDDGIERDRVAMARRVEPYGIISL